MVWVWFNFISSQDGINVLLIEPLLHQIKVPADGLAHGPVSDMKGIISIHCFTLCNIPIINEVQPWRASISIIAPGALRINHRLERAGGSHTRNKLTIKLNTKHRHGSAHTHTPPTPDELPHAYGRFASLSNHTATVQWSFEE